jgi:hypothetical protein
MGTFGSRGRHHTLTHSAQFFTRRGGVTVPGFTPRGTPHGLACVPYVRRGAKASASKSYTKLSDPLVC